MTLDTHTTRVATALNAALERAKTRHTRTLDINSARVIIFSDLHRGARDAADDFRANERAYNAALAYYLRLGYTLVTLGDVEELWKFRPEEVIAAYEHSLALEAEFNKAGRYLRVWGNHDDDWSYPDTVQRLLEPIYGAPLSVYESLLFQIKDGAETLGTLFLTHGQQGDELSDQYAAFSRWVVRWFWRPLQRLTGWSFNTPAKDWQLREAHNIALYSWAQAQSRTVLVAGHTHRPVFKSLTHLEQIQHLLSELEAKLAVAPEDKRLREEVGKAAAELEWIRAQNQQVPGNEGEGPASMTKPAYFNTGCCCFYDGDITGLEIAEGEIRLVRWPDNQKRPRPQRLVSTAMKDVLAQCA